MFPRANWIILIFCFECFIKTLSATEWTYFKEICDEEYGRKNWLQKSFSVQDRIVFGQPADLGQFPFFGYSLLYPKTGSGVIMCGSSLISVNFVITAAHCLQNIRAAQFFFGSVDSSFFPKMQNGLSYANHPLYNTPKYANDIAIFKLQHAIVVSPTVAPIMLPNRNSTSESFDGVVMIAAGYGLDQNGNLPQHLMYTTINGLSDSECLLKIGSTYVKTMICGEGIEDSSICQGDSGGPLISNNTLVGVNIFGKGSNNCINNVDGFTRVDMYLDWISSLTGIKISN